MIATNLALSGSTSLQHFKSQIPRVPRDDQRKAIVVITTGGNDIIHNYGKTTPKEGAMFGASFTQAQTWIDQFALRLDAMLREITVRFPQGVQVYIATIYDPSDGTGVMRHTGLREWQDGVKILAAYNDRIRRLEKHYPFVRVVDMHQAFLGHGLHAHHWWESHYARSDPYCWMAANIEDPNDRGYDAIRRLFWNVIVRK